ncbi:hypothetical protein HRH25_09185 [Flavisolibacter sp. BT320]|nr:hypothetical protein [Flavisolibacter longurius]
MKQILLFIALFMSAVSNAQTQSPLVGTWKLISSKVTTNDSTRTFAETDLNSIKIISPTHFAVFGQNSDGSFRHAIGGAAIITADSYTESIDYGNYPNMKGRKSVFKYEVKGDQLHIRGGVDNTTFDEVWTRMK